ncbi:MAG TPA: hypothetical protein VF596_05905 [Pyrinomonadaceae bacterium]|jgi:hypothetical protein
MKKIITLTIIVFTLCINSFGQAATPQKNDKLTAAEVLTKHLASIGTPEAIAKIKSRAMAGNGRLTPLRGLVGKTLTGPVQFASVDDNLLFVMVLNSNEYPYEKVAYNGKDITVGKMPSGNRTPLGEFLKSTSNIIKQGIFGGTLSAGWTLLNFDPKNEKIEYAGLETINNRKLHKVKYSSSKSGALNINLYFEAGTFRHVISEYQYRISPAITSNELESSRLKEKRYTLVEQFRDFVQVEGVTLPQTYVLNLTTEENSVTTLEWVVNFSQFYFKETLSPDLFKVS